MNTKRTSIESCKSSPEKIDLLVVVWDKRVIDGEERDIPLGEQSLSFSSDTKPKDMIAIIKDAGKDIEDAATQAKDIRAELNKLLDKKDAK